MYMYCTSPPCGASRFGQPVQDVPQAIHAELAALDRPRKHYQWYDSTREANAHMQRHSEEDEPMRMKDKCGIVTSAQSASASRSASVCTRSGNPAASKRGGAACAAQAAR